MDRTKALTKIATEIMNMEHTYGRRNDIVITFRKVDKSYLEEFSDWSRQYHGIRTGEECFFVWEPVENGHGLLYVVQVTGDSLLTAAGELMDLVSKKF